MRTMLGRLPAREGVAELHGAINRIAAAIRVNGFML
jgi:hypothetical protein